MTNSHVLDVRFIEPRLKHPSIFKNFDNLLNGEVLTIINDHDPLPLFYQFQSERPGIFKWEYREEGPDVWQVAITKQYPPEETVGDLVRQNPAAAAVLKKYRIDYCCKGNRLLNEVCAEMGLDPAELKLQINLSTEEAPIHLRADSWSLDFLIHYIEQNHHAYVRKSLPEITELLDKVVSVHGNEHPELGEIRRCFQSIAQELTLHMQKEETILFPAIREMVKNGDNTPSQTSCSFGSIRNPIQVMEQEHAGAGEDLESIRRLSNEFIVPSNACYSFQLLYKLLEEFEEDLHQHVHLENNVLFPKAIALEEQPVLR